ncbi:ATP-binding protein [Kineococcus sp. LSe6-4]|uniref:ATP-binding protein n=1 Tax=Kineococcus halophytocola TaxID=3234027 RepID=A0ABV4H2K4_9ACTN
MCENSAGADLDLPADLSAARRARTFLRDRSCPEHGGDVLDQALLAVSELAVNAVEHGAPPVRAHVDCRGGVLHLEVSDGSPALPRCTSPEPSAESGRGVGLVAALAADWGVRRGGSGQRPGKTVWCDLGG